jgi:hypothetical protein
MKAWEFWASPFWKVIVAKSGTSKRYKWKIEK